MGFFAQVVGIFLLAVVVARLVLDRENGWTLFWVILPLLFIVLTIAAGWVRALVLTTLFGLAATALRVMLTTQRLGWSVLLLALLFTMSVYLVSRVALRLLQDRRQREI